MKGIFIRSLLLAVILSSVCFVAGAQEKVDESKLSEKAKEIIDYINELNDSTPEDMGLSMKVYYEQFGISYYNLGMEYYRSHQFDEALQSVRKSAPYFQKAENREYEIEAYFFIADLCYHLDRYELMSEAYVSALDITDDLDTYDAKVSVLLQYLEKVRKIKDRIKEQELLTSLQAININELELSTRLYVIQSNLDYAFLISDYDLATIYMEEYRRQMGNFSDDTNQLIVFYNYEARYYAEAGAYREAAACYERQIPLSAQLDTQFVPYIQTLYYYACAGDEQKFDEYLPKVIEIKNSPSTSDEVWLAICNHIILSANRIQRLELSLEITGEVEAKGIKDRYILSAKRDALYQLGRYAEASDASEDYLDICRKTYGNESLEAATALRILGHMEGFSGDLDGGAEHLVESARMIQRIFRRELPYVPFDRLEGFWTDLSRNLSAMAGYYIRAGLEPGEFSIEAYNTWVLSKGLLLASETSFADYVEKSSDEQLKSLYSETLSLRVRLEELKKSYVENKDEIQALQPELVLKESMLSMFGSGWTGSTGNLDVTYEELRTSLKDNEVVMDFVDYTLDTGMRKYAAFVYRKDWEAPVIASVCMQSDLDAIEAMYSRPDAIYGRKSSSQFIDLLWKPLEKYVNEGDVVYMIPSGDLHLISFDSFHLRDRSLLGSRYDFVRLSSARELLEGASSSGSVSDAVLYGGLQYDMTVDDRLAEAGKHPVRQSRSSSRSVRGSGERFVELPMSGQEVASVSELLDGSGVSVTCYVGKEGTEESFMGLSVPSPDIIHFATHGFYYTPEDATEVSGLSGYKSAMRLSGLVLAGGNAEWMGEDIPRNTLGGILTADDIAQCDLSGTGLVVLTACDTGKGKVTSEGVYGLQRAFKKAGADTVLMSLWKVDDKAAAEFIGIFYESLTSNGWNKRAALKSAKEKMRYKYPSPYYWAGFIMLD